MPQQIYLADDSVTANIAFGVHEKSIDQKAVERAAKIANLHEFILAISLVVTPPPWVSVGYGSQVGSASIIGITRALYHNPQVLVLDEATSSLDKLTEQAVMEAVNNLGNEITIIIIAHRLSTVCQCDQIFLLSPGQLEG